MYRLFWNSSLKEYKIWHLEQRFRMGDRWHESDRLFTTGEGLPFNPDTLSSWFSDFMKAHSDVLPYVWYTLYATQMQRSRSPQVYRSQRWLCVSVTPIRQRRRRYTPTQYALPTKRRRTRWRTFSHRQRKRRGKEKTGKKYLSDSEKALLIWCNKRLLVRKHTSVNEDFNRNCLRPLGRRVGVNLGLVFIKIHRNRRKTAKEKSSKTA